MKIFFPSEPRALTPVNEEGCENLNLHGARMRNQTGFGFTLIEMLVVMAIFAVISTLILANHSKFNSSAILGSLAYDMALSVRQAQVYGLSVQTYQSNFQVGYGIHFPSATEYDLFVDSSDVNRNPVPDGQYDGNDTIIKRYNVGQGHTISNGCVYNSSGQSVCSGSGGGGALTFIDIVFFRPNPDAIITSNVAGYTSSAKITVSSSSGERRTITVASTGQISVSNP